MRPWSQAALQIPLPAGAAKAKTACGCASGWTPSGSCGSKVLILLASNNSPPNPRHCGVTRSAPVSPRRSRLPKVWIWSSISLVGPWCCRCSGGRASYRRAWLKRWRTTNSTPAYGWANNWRRCANSTAKSKPSWLAASGASQPQLAAARLRLALDQQRQLVLRSGNPRGRAATAAMAPRDPTPSHGGLPAR